VRELAFIAAMLGIFILAGIFYFSKPIVVNGPDELEGLNDNQKIFVEGVVDEEKFNEKGSAFYIKDIRIICRGCRESYLDLTVTVEGVVEKYEDVLEVDALIVKKSV